MSRSSKSVRGTRKRPDAYSVAVLAGALSNLLRDVEILTNAAMDDLAASRAARGVPYVPEQCMGIREAVRDSYVHALTERLITGMNDDPGPSRSEFSE
jgi:hypothetical protein